MKATEIVRVSAATALLVALVLLPLYMIILTTTKPTGEARTVNLTPPSRFAFFDNLAEVLTRGNVLSGFMNSVLVTVPSVLVLLIIGAGAAWVFGRAKERSMQAMYYVLISGIMLPPAIVTTLRVMQALELDGSRISLILFYCAAQLSIAIFLFTGFVKAIPTELEEAARIDGASALRIFYSIVLPLLRPVLLTASIILTLFIWNDFLVPFFLIGSPDLETMPLGLYAFASANEYEFNWNLIFTHVLLVSLPLFVMYVIFQRRVVSGLLGGALK